MPRSRCEVQGEEVWIDEALSDRTGTGSVEEN